MNALRALRLPLAVAMLLPGMSMYAQQAGSLQATLHALDESSAKFVSAQASFKKDLYTKIVNDHDMQDGLTYAIRKGGSTEVGIKFVGNGARTIEYKGSIVRDYNPGLNCYNTYAAAKYKATADSVLGLSFGASGKELESNWTITDLGPDSISVDGKSVKVEKLDLIPKDPGMKNNFTHVALWTDLSTAISLKQVFYAQSGDTQTATYSNIKLNQKVDTAPFEIKGKACSK
jgi:outer membrane lipoprotein-sorting protein